MARQPRVVLPGVAMHIVQRGNNRMRCFSADEDFAVYLALLRQLAPKQECAIHAYCLMPNHVHILATPARLASSAALMKELSQRYTHYFNEKHQRTGTLWEGRFRSCVAESARYALACYRYIELNPVRAGIVPHPALYPWSSYAVNIGIHVDPLLAHHAEFTALASDDRPRRAVYRHLVEQGLAPSLLAAIRDATQGGYPLGSERFKSTVALPPGRHAQRRRPGPATQCGQSSVPDPELEFGA
jgi:putative transposase